MGNLYTDTYGGNTYSNAHGSGGNLYTNTYGSSTPSSGGGPVHHASSGESTFLGGIFGGVAHAVESVVHPVEAPLHFYNNKILQPASDLAGGFALGLGELGKVTGEDLYNTWRHPHLHPTKENSHFYNDIVVPQAHDVSNKFSPIVENPQKGSSYDAVRKDPFGTALDLLALGTIPFGAEGAALKGATLADRAGMADTALGRGLARAAVRANEARKPYDVTYAPNEAEGGVFKADRARTTQGRYLYNPVREAVGKAFKGQIPFIGNAARFSRYAHQMTSIELGPDYALLRSFDTAIGAHVRSAKRLTQAERVTLDLIPGYGPDTARAAELGVPRQQLLEFYSKKLELTRQALERENLGRGARAAARVEQRALKGKIRLLTRHAAEIDEAIKNPRPILTQVTEQARHVADSIGNWMIDAHLASPETIAERPYLEQKLLSDATYSKGKNLGSTGALPDYAEKRAAYDAAAAEHDALAAQAAPEITLYHRSGSIHARQLAERGIDPAAASPGAPGVIWASTSPDEALYGPHMVAFKIRADDPRIVEVRPGSPGHSQYLLSGKIRPDEIVSGRDTRAGASYQYGSESKPTGLAAENLRHARTQPGRRVPIQQEPGFYGGNINFDEIRLEHPDAFYRPHAGPTPAGKGQYEPAGGSGVGAPKRPGETRLNTGHRFSTGQTESGPQVWTRAGLHVLRFRAIRDTLERYRPIMVPYDGVGGSAPLREGYGPVNIQFTKDGIKPASLGRGQKESAALDENLLSLTPAQEQQRLTAELNNLFPAEHTHLQVATFQMPLKDIKKIKGDYKRSNIVVRNLVDKPLAVWKALVLKNRPAWLINNLFGQHALLLLHNGLQWQNYVAALSPKRRQELNDAIPGLLMQGTSNLAAGSARISERQGRMLAGYYGRSARGAALAGHGAAKVFNAWGDGISKFNQELADNVPRTALAIKYVKEQQQAMRHLEIAHGAVESAVKGKTITEAAHLLTQDQKAEILRKTNRYLGDFGSMSGASARNVRRVLPFATWFKVIMQITTDLTLDHPEKLLFLQALERAGKRDKGLAPNMKLLPSWYQGSLLAPIVAGPSAAGTQPLLSTTAINPFMTPVQLTQQVSSFFKTGQPGASDNPVSSLGPIAEAVLLAENVDPFFGGAYTGPGQKQSPLVRAAAGTLFGLPEMRLLQQGGVAPYYRPPASYKDTYVNVGGHQVPLDALLRYFGYPLRRVDKAKAQGYAKEGR